MRVCQELFIVRVYYNIQKNINSIIIWKIVMVICIESYSHRLNKREGLSNLFWILRLGSVKDLVFWSPYNVFENFGGKGNPINWPPGLLAFFYLNFLSKCFLYQLFFDLHPSIAYQINALQLSLGVFWNPSPAPLIPFSKIFKGQGTYYQPQIDLEKK